jgi:hypothetical protein
LSTFSDGLCFWLRVFSWNALEDEKFLDIVVDMLLEGEGRARGFNPWTQSARRALARGEQPAASACLQRMVRQPRADEEASGYARQVRPSWGLDREDLQLLHVGAAYGAYANVEYRKRYRPTELDDELWTKVRKTVFKELPRFESQRARHTGSTLRQKGASWLDSERGQAWAAQRAKLFGSAEAADHADAAEEDEPV